MPPRARGRAHVATRRLGARSVLKDLHQSGSMRVLFPRPAAPPTAMLLNTAGGITGGDTFDISAHAETGSHLTLTTQAAERIYAANSGATGKVLTQLEVGENASLWWLPQETILFDKSALDRRLHVDLGENAEALLVEPLVFGRTASGEVLNHCLLRDRVRITQNGRVIYADGIAVDTPAIGQLTHPAIADGAGAMATLVQIGPRAQPNLDPVRERIAQNSSNLAGASLLTPEILVLRALAPDSFALRQLLLPILDDLTGGRLPICWRL